MEKNHFLENMILRPCISSQVRVGGNPNVAVPEQNSGFSIASLIWSLLDYQNMQLLCLFFSKGDFN